MATAPTQRKTVCQPVATVPSSRSWGGHTTSKNFPPEAFRNTAIISTHQEKLGQCVRATYQQPGSTSPDLKAEGASSAFPTFLLFRLIVLNHRKTRGASLKTRWCHTSVQTRLSSLCAEWPHSATRAVIPGPPQALGSAGGLSENTSSWASSQRSRLKLSAMESALGIHIFKRGA